MLTAEGLVTYASPPMRGTLGYDPALLVGRPLAAFSSTPTRSRTPPSCCSTARSRSQTGSDPSLPLSLRHADGGWREVDVTIDRDRASRQARPDRDDRSRREGASSHARRAPPPDGLRGSADPRRVVVHPARARGDRRRHPRCAGRHRSIRRRRSGLRLRRRRRPCRRREHPRVERHRPATRAANGRVSSRRPTRLDGWTNSASLEPIYIPRVADLGDDWDSRTRAVGAPGNAVGAGGATRRPGSPGRLHRLRLDHIRATLVRRSSLVADVCRGCRVPGSGPPRRRAAIRVGVRGCPARNGV